MLILALDTAGENCAVVLATGGNGLSVHARRVEPVGRGHAERLMPMIGEVLGEAGMTYASLERIAVTIGPGSFTGTRIGVAAARGLALALGIPAVGVSVLDALIEAAQGNENGLVAAVLDARRGEIYAKAVAASSGEIVYEAQVTTAADLAQAIAGRGGGPVTLTGSAAADVAGMLGEADIPATIDGEAACADIGIVAALGMLAESGTPPVPLYLRPPDAKPQTGVTLARK
ncbi:MAG TPA: tRNA (adenosine(37)-N6)-threonylcarbamoyltransferase complex dimerization subunit type 1 TsaB [Afifellaceae bacterium]|nr:tRNA (adenosine(37)-N6)-threonylcarbamoyltransferase complex dimerization subunit type 1 TsaB [Afifellaceae bacterium]